MFTYMSKGDKLILHESSGEQFKQGYCQKISRNGAAAKPHGRTAQSSRPRPLASDVAQKYTVLF